MLITVDPQPLTHMHLKSKQQSISSIPINSTP